MAKVECSPNASGNRSPLQAADFPTRSFPLHRLAVVRRQENISLRAVARHLGKSVANVKFQELETTDLPLSILHKWREVLGVPVAELLVEPDDRLSLPLMKRARLVRLMKTTMAILERARRAPIKRMAQTLVDQLIEIMPELRDVGSWHLVGKRRRCDEYGRAAEHSLPDDMFVE